MICREKNRHDGQGLLTWVEYRVIVCLMEGSVFRESWVFHATYRNVFWPNKKREPKFRRGFQLGPCLACCGCGRGFGFSLMVITFGNPRFLSLVDACVKSSISGETCEDISGWVATRNSARKSPVEGVW